MSENLALANYAERHSECLTEHSEVAPDHPRPLGDGGSDVPGAPANKLYFGDNLDVLREYVDDESVDLIYLDPPFNSQAHYNLVFERPSMSAHRRKLAHSATHGCGATKPSGHFKS